MPLRIEMDSYGPPEVLRPVERAAVDPRPDEVIVRMLEMRVLIQGGSSAVGLMAIQLCKRARTLATTTQREKFAVLERAGADECICTWDAEWWKKIEPVDRVFDLVGQATFSQSVSKLSDGGKLLFVGGTSGADLTFWSE